MNKYEKMDWWFNDLTPKWLPMYLSRYYIGFALIISTLGVSIGLARLVGFWWSMSIYIVIYSLAGIAGATIPDLIKMTWQHKEEMEKRDIY